MPPCEPCSATWPAQRQRNSNHPIGEINSLIAGQLDVSGRIISLFRFAGNFALTLGNVVSIFAWRPQIGRQIPIVMAQTPQVCPSAPKFGA